MLSLVAAVLFALVIGGSLGLLGGGGSILTVPVLVYALDVPDKKAIAMSLLIVSITSLVAALQNARHGNVAFRPAALFAASASIGALAGGRLAGYLPAPVLLLMFGMVMLMAAVAMWRKSTAEAQPVEPQPVKHAGWTRVVPLALAVGFLTGLVGAGGGFLIVPVLTLLIGIPMRRAIGTSLAVISINTLSGFIGYMGHVTIDWRLTLVMAGSAIVGSVLGAKLGKKASPASLRRWFAVFTFAMAIVVLYKESAKWPQVANLMNNTAAAWIGGVTVGVLLSALIVSGLSALRQARDFKNASATLDEQWFYEI
jgi:uncharacterized membrane protein YfcA